MPHPYSYADRQAEIDRMEAWRRQQQPLTVPFEITGLKPRPSDPRDLLMPSVCEFQVALAAGLPDTADLVRSIQGPALNQGGVPSCVSHTCAGMMQIFQWEEEAVWRWFDAPRAHRETGDVSQGRWPDDLLRYCQSSGMPLANTEIRYKILRYVFAPKTGPKEWADSIKAAIVSGHPCPVCMLLPSTFSWESGGNITQGYHEVLIIGFRPDAFLIRNSWGESWGRNGMGWVPIDYLTQANWQNGYVLAHTVTDEVLTTPPPPPPGPKIDRVTGTLPAPDAPPQTYLLNTEMQVWGSGFTSPNVRARIGPTSEPASRVSEAQITVALASKASGPLVIGVEALEATGPLIRVIEKDEEPPPEPEALTLSLYMRRFRSLVAAWVSVRKGSRFVRATVTCLVNEEKLIDATNSHTETGIPAVFMLRESPGARLLFKAIGPDGSGTLAAAVPGEGAAEEPLPDWL